MSKSKSDGGGQLAISAGEPAGVGPDICLLAHGRLAAISRPVYFGDPRLFNARAAEIGIKVDFNNLSSGAFVQGAFNVCPIDLEAPVVAGSLDATNAPYVLGALKAATKACLAGRCVALVTGPVNKAGINAAGITFAGHTEWLQEFTGASRVVMMLISPSLRVALATTHLPLSQVPKAITTDLLEGVIQVTCSELKKRFAIERPHIMVCGLNPHAGEDGHLGTEEIEVIGPAIRSLASQGLHITGPVPADTAFIRNRLQDVDAVVAMYHDQGLPALKATGFGEAVNITLGLPIVRTSVDHGTALDIAGTGKADPTSFIAAVETAMELAH